MRRGGFISVVVGTAAGFVAFGGAVSPAFAACPDGSGPNVGGYGSLSPGEHPDECWRPYSDNSPFNWRIPANARTHQKSDAQVRELFDQGIDAIVRGDREKDMGVSLFFADAATPTKNIDCLENWGTCELEDVPVPFPAEAIPSGEWPLPSSSADYDSHVTIVDQDTQIEHDLWNVRSIWGDSVGTSWGGETRIRGKGLGSGAVAAEYGSLGGLIRAEELVNGRIDHALSLSVPCTSGHTYPGTKVGRECSDVDFPANHPLPQGALVRLRMDRDEIKKKVPGWLEPIYLALERYGAYIGDTTGHPGHLSVKVESQASYTAFNQEDPLLEYARDLGFPEPEDYNGNGQPEASFTLEQPEIDLARKMEVVTARPPHSQRR